MQFYENLYELDEVERPTDKVINDDKKLDAWWKSYRANVRAKLLEYHKNNKTVDKGVPKPRWSMGK